MRKLILCLVVALITNTCNVFALTNYNDIDNAGGAGNSKMRLKVENTGSGDDAVFSAWVPAELPITMDLDGNVITPSKARIVNGVETKGIQVTDLEVSLDDGSGWVLAGFNENFDAKEANLKELALQFRGNNVNTNGVCMLTAGNWDIPKDSYIDLNMKAKVPKRTEVSNVEEISKVSFTFDWSGDDTTVGPEIPTGSLELSYIEGEHGSIIDMTALYTDEYGRVLSLPDVEADEGYVLLEWIDVSTGLEVQIGDVLTVATTIQPVFIESTAELPERKVTVYFTAEEGGTVSANRVSASKGTTWGQITKPVVVPNVGYEIDGYYVDDELITSDYIINNNLDVRIRFKLDDGVSEYFTYGIANNEAIITGITDKYSEDVIEGIAPNVLVIPSEINGVTVTSIEDGAFFGATDIRQVIMPDTITSVGEFVFSGCSNLQDITLSKNLEIIGESFCSDTAITELIIPDSVKTIGAYAFEECNLLTDLTVGEGVETIGENAFSFTGLTDVNIPNSVTSIGEYAFSDSQLQSVTIGSGLSDLGLTAFVGNPELTSFVIADANTTYNSIDNVVYSEDGTKLIFVPGGLSGTYNVLDGTVEIVDSALYRQGKLTELNTPDSLKTIGDSAFERTTSLKVINLPDTLETFGVASFKQCAVERMVIPSSVTVIPERCFYECAVSDLQIHDGVTKIEKYGLFRCSNISELNIPENIEILGDCALGYLTGLKGELNINVHNCDIGNYLLCGCSGLKSVKIVTNSIGGSTLQGCLNVETVDIYAEDTLGGYSLANCPSVKNAKLETHAKGTSENPKYLSNPGGSPNMNLEIIAPNLYVDKSFNVFEEEGIHLKLNVDVIKTQAFRPYDVVLSGVPKKQVKSVDIKCNTIESYAFENSTIESASIEVVNMAGYVFRNCANLDTMTLKGTGSLQPMLLSDAELSSLTIKDTTMPGGLLVYSSINDLTIDNCVIAGGGGPSVRNLKITNTDFRGASGLFASSSSLESVYLENCTNFPTSGMFPACSNLQKVEVYGCNTIASQMFTSCSKLTEVIIGEGTTSIGASAFSGCTAITELVVPDTVATIGTDAFKGVPLVRYSGSAEGSPWGADSVVTD